MTYQLQYALILMFGIGMSAFGGLSLTGGEWVDYYSAKFVFELGLPITGGAFTAFVVGETRGWRDGYAVMMVFLVVTAIGLGIFDAMNPHSNDPALWG